VQVWRRYTVQATCSVASYRFPWSAKNGSALAYVTVVDAPYLAPLMFFAWTTLLSVDHARP
jgi:hypothetical protein